jgi:hypothetical protein
MDQRFVFGTIHRDRDRKTKNSSLQFVGCFPVFPYLILAESLPISLGSEPLALRVNLRVNLWVDGDRLRTALMSPTPFPVQVNESFSEPWPTPQILHSAWIAYRTKYSHPERSTLGAETSIVSGNL